MDTGDQLSVDSLRRALQDVTGDASAAHAGQAELSARVQELLASDERDYATELARSLARQAAAEAPQLPGLPRVVYKTRPAAPPLADVGAADLPTHSTLDPDCADALVSPASLGFQGEPFDPILSRQALTHWTEFIVSAEHNISKRQSFFRHLADLFLPGPACTAERKARNYELVSLEAGKDKSTAHFLFEATHLYLVVVVNNEETCRAKVQYDDVASFTDKIANAFNGRTELVKGTLTHLLSTLPH